MSRFLLLFTIIHNFYVLCPCHRTTRPWLELSTYVVVYLWTSRSRKKPLQQPLKPLLHISFLTFLLPDVDVFLWGKVDPTLIWERIIKSAEDSLLALYLQKHVVPFNNLSLGDINFPPTNCHTFICYPPIEKSKLNPIRYSKFLRIASFIKNIVATTLNSSTDDKHNPKLLYGFMQDKITDFG